MGLTKLRRDIWCQKLVLFERQKTCNYQVPVYRCSTSWTLTGYNRRGWNNYKFFKSHKLTIKEKSPVLVQIQKKRFFLAFQDISNQKCFGFAKSSRNLGRSRTLGSRTQMLRTLGFANANLKFAATLQSVPVKLPDTY